MTICDNYQDYLRNSPGNELADREEIVSQFIDVIVEEENTRQRNA